MNRRNFMKTGALLAGGLFLPKSAKAEEKDEDSLNLDKEEVILQPHISPNLHKKDYWRVDWNSLRDEQDRLEYTNEILADDKGDEREWIEGKWMSGSFSTQLNFNTFGFKKFKPEHADVSQMNPEYDITKLGFYNIPVYTVGVSAYKFGHGMNAILIGDENNGDPRIWDNWCFIEPQKDWIVNIDSQSIPRDSEVIIDRPYRVYSNRGVGSAVELLRFNIINKIPSLNEDSVNPNLILSRPGPASVAQEKPTEFSLSQNYPNPFNPSTTIEYNLETPGDVEMKIYNQTGQYLETIINGNQSAGKHSVNWNGGDYGSGNYFYELNTEYGRESGKMSLVK